LLLNPPTGSKRAVSETAELEIRLLLSLAVRLARTTLDTNAHAQFRQENRWRASQHRPNEATWQAA
jgi:hypothetical protein